MITIKKYPNRRLYNTATSTYINLEGIQNLILDGETVEILDSKTNANVTTATLLLHALDTDVIEALVPSIWMQELMRMASNEIRLSAIQSLEDSEESSESETQEEKTLPKVATIQPVDMIVAALEDDSESSDSDSEVTIVRAEKPPTEPVVTNIDASTPIEVQVSMDAWGGSSELEDSEIPSFWSDNSFDVNVLDDAEDSEVGESSDDGLFAQPETVVVRYRDPVDLVSMQPPAKSIQSDALDDVDFELDASEDERSQSLEDSLASSDNQLNSDEGALSSSVAEPEEEQGTHETSDKAPVSKERPSINAVSESTTPVLSTDSSVTSSEISKSEQMKARLAAMRAKLKR